MNKKRGRRHKKKGKTDLDTVIADFLACGRCSFFLAGYRVLHGSDSLEQAAEDSDEQWLALAWDYETRRLVQSSYGSRLDIEFYYYDGRCPECQRRFVIGSGEDVAEPGADPVVEPEDRQTEHETPESPEPPEPSTLRMALTAM